MQEVKAAFDPDNLMNPQRSSTRPPAESLRFGPTTPIEPETVFDWDADGGYVGAIEMCNGAASCLSQPDIGTMCPSFMATKDEREPTRASSNARSTAPPGASPPTVFAHEMYEIMHLCSGLQGVQNRVPLLRGHGENQVRVSRPLLPRQRHAALQPYDGLAARDRRMALQAGLLRLHAPRQLGYEHAHRQSAHVADRRSTRSAPCRYGERKPETGSTAAPTTASRPPSPNIGPNGPAMIFHDTWVNYNETQIGMAMVRFC